MSFSHRSRKKSTDIILQQETLYSDIFTASLVDILQFWSLRYTGGKLISLFYDLSVLDILFGGFQWVAVFVDSDWVSDTFLNGFGFYYFVILRKMPRDKEINASETVSLDINVLRQARTVIVRSLINSLREVQEVIDSDTNVRLLSRSSFFRGALPITDKIFY